MARLWESRLILKCGQAISRRETTMSTYPMPPSWVLKALRDGLVIPAHPLALTSSRKLDERRQRALTRYYHAAGVGGIAVGVHTTQFEIRRPKHGLFKPVLELGATTARACDAAAGRSPFSSQRTEGLKTQQTVLVGGICGRTQQALREAELIRDAGYHAGLLSLGAFQKDEESVILRHCQAVGREVPIFGFYLQPAVGGRVLSAAFWRNFAEIPNVVGIKIAAFNRYQTLDVIRAVAQVGRTGEVALYTGNDDNIVLDLLTQYSIQTGLRKVQIGCVGGLLGHWACWTRSVVQLLRNCQQERQKSHIPRGLLTLAGAVTDCNGAFFDAANQFAGCIPGIHEILRRQGLLANLVCLDESLTLSPGQRQEIDRVYRAYPDLNDDRFVQEHLDAWLA
jgi:dihydrodipicolinate synthase/N-acetylneuraminate lyase